MMIAVLVLFLLLLQPAENKGSTPGFSEAFFRANISEEDSRGQEGTESIPSLISGDVPPSPSDNSPSDVIKSFGKDFPIPAELCGEDSTFSCQHRCGTFRKAPCSCHVQCLIYRTCCHDFEELCQETGQELTAVEEQYLHAVIECPETLRWPVVASCLQNRDSHSGQRCHSSGPVTKSDIIPVTDTASGIHFRNLHCAVCNGVAVSSLLPWSGEFLLSEEVSTVEELFDRAIHTTSGPGDNRVRWQSPGKGVSHGRCIPDRELSLPRSRCQNETFQKCLSAHSSYTTAAVQGEVRTYRNRYCLLCDTDQEFFTSCGPAEMEEDPDSAVQQESVNMTWSDLNRKWIFQWGSLNPVTVPEDIVFCDAREDLEPDRCWEPRCQAGDDLENNLCQAISPFSYTLVLAFQTLLFDMYGEGINSTALLWKGSQLFYNLSRDDNNVLVSLEQATAVRDHHSRLFSFKAFINILTYLKGFNPREEMKAFVLSLLQNRGINFARICSKMVRGHVRVGINCTNFTAYRLVYEGQNTLRNPAFFGDFTEGEKWSWRNYLSIAFISLSIVSLTVRVSLQPVLTFFHSSANRLQFFLCLSLLIGYVAFILGGFPSSRSLGCVLTAVATHWAMLSALLWMNVNAVQIWRIFRPHNLTRLSGHGAIHGGWHLYAWLAPLLLVGPQVALDQLHPGSPYAPLYGQGQCWFNRGRALLLFFIVPSLFISVVNLLLLILITYAVHTQKMPYGTDSTSILLEARACSKLVVLVGVTWLLGIPVVVHDEPILGDIFTLANANLGFFITVAIMGNKFFIKNARDQMARKGGRSWLQTRSGQLPENCPRPGHRTPSASPEEDPRSVEASPESGIHPEEKTGAEEAAGSRNSGGLEHSY